MTCFYAACTAPALAGAHVISALPDPGNELVRLIGGRRDDIAGLCLELGNLPDLCGEEIAVAHALSTCYADAGLRPRLQHLSSSSANVIAVIWIPRAASRPSRTSGGNCAVPGARTTC
jgi:hypothetical protein